MAKKKSNNIPNRRLVTKQKRQPRYMKKNHAVILFVVSFLVLVGAFVGLILTR